MSGDSNRRSRRLRWAYVSTAFVVIVLAEALVYALMKSKGVSTTGDEPHYLIAAKALSHFTIHPLGAYKVDLRTHQIFNWAPGTKPSNLNFQLFSGPHGAVNIHNLGLSALLAPFVAIGGAKVGRLAMMALDTAGFIYVFTRAAGLARLNSRAKVVFALVLASPAIWLAGTQIYPDLLTGIVMTCALMDVGAIETRGRLDALGIGVSGFSVAILPWLHQQNFIPAVFLLIAFAVVAARARLWRPFVIIGVVSVASWLLLVAYNVYAYGHALGLPQPFPSLNGAAVTDILGLLVDRHQGLFVQVPTAALGLVGLWMGRRIAPVAVIATVAAAASLLYLNGTFIGAPYGGTSLAGRFEWSSLVPLLAWCPLVIASGSARARLWVLGGVAGALWIFESVPILLGDHIYYNQLTGGAPWDPSTYPGWWGGFDRLLPELVPGGRLLGVPWFGFPVALLILGGLVLVAGGFTRLRRDAMFRLAIGSLAAVIVLGVLANVARLPLPSTALTLTAELGGPLRAATPTGATRAVAMVGVGAGSYDVKVAYTLDGATGSAGFAAFCKVAGASTMAPGAPPDTVPRTGSHVVTLPLRCPPSIIGFDMNVEKSTTLVVDKLSLTKTASG